MEIKDIGIKGSMSDGVEIIQWRGVEDQPGREHDGRWVVTRFPPQTISKEGGGTERWLETRFRVGVVFNGEISWFWEDVAAGAAKPTHWAFLHAKDDPAVVGNITWTDE